MSPLLVRKETRLDPRHQAFPFQAEAVEAVRHLEYAALFHEQGLGKTKIGLDLALSWLRDDVIDSALIVTKRSLVNNWSNEIKAHTFFEARLLGQDRKANFFALNSPVRLYLTHYEVLKSERRRISLFQKTRRVGIILDESQKIKNPEADLTKTALSLAPGFVRRVIMTGTPIANRPYDIWSQIFFLDGGKTLGTSFAEFRCDLDITSDLASNMALRKHFEEALDKIFRKLQYFSVRATKQSSGIQLPEKYIENVPVELEERQRKIYEQIKRELRIEVVKNGLLVEDNAEDILKRLIRLVQIASNPALIDESYHEVPGKLLAARRLVGQALATDSKAILWTSFIDNAEWLGRVFAEVGSAVVHGRKSIEERNIALESFKNDLECRVLIATPGAAKEGLTLTMASHAVFYDRSFSLDDYLQAQDRIHRISQERNCYIWNLVATDTIDVWVDMLLAAKHLAAQLAQGDISFSDYKNQAHYDFGYVFQEILGVEDRDEHYIE